MGAMRARDLVNHFSTLHKRPLPRCVRSMLDSKMVELL
jgi:hypothetical protein